MYHTLGLTFIGATGLALLLTGVVVKIGRATGVVDGLERRKIHSAPVPRVGGLAIGVGMVVPAILAIYAAEQLDLTQFLVRHDLAACLVGGLLVFVVGLVDDLYGLHAGVKLFSHVLAATLVCASGVRIDALGVGDLFVLELGWFASPLTVLWIVGVTNAINLIDGLDGLAAGISLVTCAVIALIAVNAGALIIAVFSVALMGSLVGFLCLNLHPAKLFMGDSGSNSIGFTLAAMSVMLSRTEMQYVGLALPAIALGLPILDATFSVLRRTVERRSPFTPDRSHIHHQLLARGFGHRRTVMLLHLATVCATAIGSLMLVTGGLMGLVVLVAAYLLLLSMFRLTGAIRLRETIAILRSNRIFSHLQHEQRRIFEELELELREVRTFDQWWRFMRSAAERMEFERLTLRIDNRDGTTRELCWQHPRGRDGNCDTIVTCIPVRQRRPGPHSLAEVRIPINGSLENTARAVTFFGRLLDERSIGDLPRRAGIRRRVESPARAS